MIKFKKLKLKGFKSFVEPSEIYIEHGLTGIVGPNGCGKSNLVEAFRFVMGELSPKQMRGSELDDVIFNGTTDRPAWDIAEVSIDLDNSERKAPSMFNQSDEIEVTRRIWRGEGSDYLVNGKEVRLKDVQLLFADASTGARSTSMVSQGRVSAIIAAKPEHRRNLLEEAAGITGLHSRRHDAELRLNATENNLERVKDVLKNQEDQLEVLNKQSKQAERYKNIQKDISKARAGVFYQKWQVEKDKLAIGNDNLKNQNNLVADQTQTVTKANIDYEKIQQELPGLRLEENKTASELQRNTINLDNQEKEIKRANNSIEEIDVRLQQIINDLNREKFLLEDAEENLTKVHDEKSLLEKNQGDLFINEDNKQESNLNVTKNDNPIIDFLDFEDGYEKALAAVFSDELMASINEEQSSFWRKLSNNNYQSSFPNNITPLSKIIKAPENLKKRLDFIGLIKSKENIIELQNNLADGQVLVSEEGEIWRWDGYISKGKQNASTKAILDQLNNRRLKQLTAEEEKWQNIIVTAKKRIEELNDRQNSLNQELVKVKSMPKSISLEKNRLQKLIDENKSSYEVISSQLQETERRANNTNKKLKLEEVRVNELREEKIRIEGIISTHKESINLLTEQVKERLNIGLDQLFELAKINPNKIISLGDSERKLERLISEQERLGGVNLLAEQEFSELDDKIKSIKNDQSDLLSAISKLREAIEKLNVEGRQRLLAAFSIVNENFQKLFTQLFGGGKAYLKFTDETDPLQAGLEIYASPPGKKLQNLNLLSGGEQALTALSLLFAVFLSNPAPICVLDEVDAPLDDTNVDRFCSLVEEIAKTSMTKFLVITHHRMTMARVNRLFGVTMPEKGVSQIVSVDLDKAVQIRENE